MTISLSIDNLIKQLHASSALLAITTADSPNPTILTDDNNSALRSAIGNAVASTSMRLIGVVTDIDFDTEVITDVEIITLTVDDSLNVVARLLQRAIESAVIFCVMASIYTGPNHSLAQSYQTRWAQAVDNIRHIASSPTDFAALSLTPYNS